MKLVNGKNRCLNEQALDLPDVSDAVQLFLQPMKMDLVRKEQVDGYTQETTKCLTGLAVRQPFTAQQLAIKPEGERHWKWSTLHAEIDICLKLDDIVKIRDVKYRIMERLDWTEYGYNEYHMVEDYKYA